MGRKPDVQGFLVGGIVGTAMLIFFVVIGGIFFDALKESSPNEQTKELIEEQENNFWSGVNIWILLTGIAGTIVLFFIIYKFIIWAIGEFGGSSNGSWITA